jgi:phosphoribosylaminoimidazole (AIR) synthetase
MFRVFNMGLGMVLACDPDSVGRIQAAVPDARVVGEVAHQGDGDPVVIET